MKLIHNPDRKYLDIHTADIIAKKTSEILKMKDNAVWALPGGRSVGGIFDVLSEKDDIRWDRVHFFMADERLVAIDNIESNFRLLMERLLFQLLKNGSITRKNMHPFIYKPGNKDAGLGIYKKELIKFGGKYDLVLLSSGEDGHIAGLYPEHDSINNKGKYFIKMDDSPKPPPKRMSSSRALLKVSHTAILLFFGSGKKHALEMFKNPGLTIEECPARLVLSIDDSYILTDQDHT